MWADFHVSAIFCGLTVGEFLQVADFDLHCTLFQLNWFCEDHVSGDGLPKCIWVSQLTNTYGLWSWSFLLDGERHAGSSGIPTRKVAGVSTARNPFQVLSSSSPVEKIPYMPAISLPSLNAFPNRA